MSTVTFHVGDVMPDDVEELDHYSCCDAPVGSVEPMLCGVVEEVEDDEADHVACVVCTDLEAADWCPRHGRCPYNPGVRNVLGYIDE